MSIDRSTYIGGSDAAALMGSNKYKTALDVWERLRGKEQPEFGGKHIDRGNQLEPLIEQWIRENQDYTINGESLYEKYDSNSDSDQILLQDPSDPRLAGHPDGMANGPVTTPADVIWEIKSPTSYSVEKIRRHGLPSRYKWQVQWYMHLANKQGRVERAMICVWDCDEWNNPIIFSVPRKEAKGRELEQRAKDMLFCVEMGQKPAASDYPTGETETVGDEELDRMLGEYQEVKKIEKRLKEERKRLKSKIVTRVDGMKTVQTENNLARLKYNHGRYDATYLTVSER